ncbi:hypothetical protein V6N13_142070 [Hibiscus sabdariffa]
MIISSEIVFEIFRKSQLNLLQNQASHRLFRIKALNKFNLEIKEEVKEIIQRLLLTRNLELQFEFIISGGGRNDEKSLEVITKEPVQILDRKIKRLRNKSVPLVKVLWKNQRVEELTWETEVAMREQYRHLFNSGKNSRTNSLLREGGIVIPRNSLS